MAEDQYWAINWNDQTVLHQNICGRYQVHTKQNLTKKKTQTW